MQTDLPVPASFACSAALPETSQSLALCCFRGMPAGAQIHARRLALAPDWLTVMKQNKTGVHRLSERQSTPVIPSATGE
jgi:hypothetical protein